MSKFADRVRFKDQLRRITREFSRVQNVDEFVGAELGEILEHNTRRHFVDPFLQALRWDTTQFNKEVIQEARTRGSTTLRLDYLGVNQQSRIPILIVEAKPWGAPFVSVPARSAGRGEMDSAKAVDLVCAAIEHCKEGGEPSESPVTAEWARYLAQLRQYVLSIKNESAHVVKCVAMISGQWLVIVVSVRPSHLA